VKRLFAVALVLVLSVIAAAQVPSSYRIKSWKQGTAQVEPQTLTISLSKANPAYSKLINDVSGHPLCRLLVQPAAFVGPGDGIVAWHVYLTTPESNDNLLLPSNSLEQEEYETADYLWWFYPGQNRFVPMEAARVIQVENFYVLLEAEHVKLDGTGRLESMELAVRMSNVPPTPAP
jgi:hypothetical protein